MINGVQADAMGAPIFPPLGEPTYELELQWSQAAQQFVTRRIDYLGKLLSLVVAAPGNLNAVKAGDDVDLTWDDISGELGFYIERRFRILLLPAGEYERIATVAANDTDYTDDDVDLSPRPLGGFFEYRVQGFSASGAGFYSGSDSVSVPIAPLP